MEFGKWSFSAHSFITFYLYTAQQLSLSFGCILAFFAVKKDNMLKMHIIIGQLIPNAQSTTNLQKFFF